MKIPDLPEDAPFNEDQRQWLSGFFAGLHTRTLMQARGADRGTGRTADKNVTILYGSQTGNSESVAFETQHAAKAHGLAAHVSGMDQVDTGSLTNVETLLVITSTYGDGEMPDNAQLLWESISENAVLGMEQTQFAVLGLGDTSYDHFCQAAKDWDQRLDALGAKRLVERVDCDVDFEDPAAEWIARVIALTAGVDGLDAGQTSVPKGERWHKPKYRRKNPFRAKILSNRLLSRPGSSKEVRHYELSLGNSGLTYEPGDVLSVIPTNCPQLVEEIIGALGCRGDEEEPVNGELMTLRAALLRHCEIKLPSMDLVTEIADRSGDQELNGLLNENDRALLNAYLRGRDTLDLLLQFARIELSAAEFLGLLKPLQPRAYSISSCIKKHPGEVHLTVSSVRYESHGRRHKGVCSTFLADLVDNGTPAACFFTPNKVFRVPGDDSLPIIMVGPGTGIAPFRAFLEEREARGAGGKNWLFFGDRNADTDFLYQEELEAMQQNGLLTRLDLAFSRDQKEKIYVQQRMHEHGKELFDWLQQGAYFYVCGDAYRMARDVDQALHDIIARHGHRSEPAAYVNRMKKERRYVRDVY